MEMILGVLVSLLVQWLKRKFGAEGGHVVLYCVMISLIASGIYAILLDLGYWSEFVSVLTNAGAFYAFVIRQVEGYNEKNPPFLSKP